MARATLHRLVKCVKNFRVDITGSNGMEAAQVCAGGVDTEEIEATTLASKLADGIYFAGEVIDIDGTCGGYNLQWAWSSGALAQERNCQLKSEEHTPAVRSRQYRARPRRLEST